MKALQESLKRGRQIVRVHAAEGVFVIAGPERALLRVDPLGRRHVGIDEPHLLLVGKTNFLMCIIRHKENADTNGDIV